MTQTTTSTGRPVESATLTEPYWRYAFNVDDATARTDTPDLMKVFADGEMEAAYAEMDAAIAEVHADLGEMGFSAFQES